MQNYNWSLFNRICRRRSGHVSRGGTGQGRGAGGGAACEPRRGSQPQGAAVRGTAAESGEL